MGLLSSDRALAGGHSAQVWDKEEQAQLMRCHCCRPPTRVFGVHATGSPLPTKCLSAPLSCSKATSTYPVLFLFISSFFMLAACTVFFVFSCSATKAIFFLSVQLALLNSSSSNLWQLANFLKLAAFCCRLLGVKRLQAIVKSEGCGGGVLPDSWCCFGLCLLLVAQISWVFYFLCIKSWS